MENPPQQDVKQKAIERIKAIISEKLTGEDLLAYYIYEQRFPGRSHAVNKSSRVVYIPPPAFSCHLNEDFETAKKIFEDNFPNEVYIYVFK